MQRAALERVQRGRNVGDFGGQGGSLGQKRDVDADADEIFPRIVGDKNNVRGGRSLPINRYFPLHYQRLNVGRSIFHLQLAIFEKSME
ncbi:hypothetical protein BG418_01560 [Streptomyces sp. CBMA152]|nr:hypothetical protein [Streptomyces sp. CBMA152]